MIDVIVEFRVKLVYRVCVQVNEVLVFDYWDCNGLVDFLNLLGVICDWEYEVVLMVVW